MENEEIIRKLAQMSLEKLEADTLNELEKMDYKDLLMVLVQTKYLERQVLIGSQEVMKKLDELEKTLGYCEEMSEYLKIVFAKNFQLDIEDININFIEGEDDETDGGES